MHFLIFLRHLNPSSTYECLLYIDGLKVKYVCHKNHHRKIIILDIKKKKNQPYGHREQF